MALLRPTRVRTQAFTWVPQESLFVTEDSNLPRPSRVFDDACDVGYTFVSERTGRALVIVQDHTERDADGDILWWTYRPLSRELRDKFAVRIFND